MLLAVNRLAHVPLQLQWLTTAGRELQRRMLQEHLDLRAGSERTLVQVLGADGVEREETRPLSRALGSLFGSVTVWRLGYQAEGVARLCPLDAGLNLPPELYSYGVRRLVAMHLAPKCVQLVHGYFHRLAYAMRFDDRING